MKLNSITNFIVWLFKYKSLGLPINFYNNKKYIDWFLNYRPKLMQFQNLHKDEDCFIIGNGPSLNNMDLSLLNEYYVFGLNKINLIFKNQKINLDYHVVVNELVIAQIENDIKLGQFNCFSFVSYHASIGKKLFGDNIFQIYCRDAPWSFYSTIVEPIDEGYTVTFVALQIAYFMGFRNIFLIGVDHNFKQIGKPNEKQELKCSDLNHFDPNYFKDQQWHLADMEGNEASYALAKHEYHNDGREIYDATLEGKLNIFKKIPFHDALLKAKKKKL
jgi:hypothetical protein